MGKKAQVHVQVDEGTKDRWKRYAEQDSENHNDSLTLLVTRAVHNEINGQHRGTGDNGSVSVDLSDVTEKQAQTEKELAKVRDVVDQMETRVEEVQRAVTSDTEKRPLKERLWEVLPPAKPETEKWSRVKNVEPGASAQQWATAWSGEILEICKRVGERPEKVEEKLDEMGVPREETDKSVRYWMEGQV